VCTLLQGRRSNDRKMYRVTPHSEWRSKQFTEEFEALAFPLMGAMKVKRACQILGESDSRMWLMLIAGVKAAHARLSFDNVVWLRADEMVRSEGRKYLTVFADRNAKWVLVAKPGKDYFV